MLKISTSDSRWRTKTTGILLSLLLLVPVLSGCAASPRVQMVSVPAHLTKRVPHPAPLRPPVTVESLKMYAIEYQQRLDHANDQLEQIEMLGE